MITPFERQIYWDITNHISGCTLKEEIQIQNIIGGSLPYEAFLSMIRRKVIPMPIEAIRKIRHWRKNHAKRN